MSTIVKRALETIRNSRLMSDEKALVVGWFDVGRLLLVTAMFFVCLGPLMDAGWSYIHNADPSAGLYTDTDISTVDSVYSFFHYIPIVSLGVGLYFIVNYSNMKRGE